MDERSARIEKAAELRRRGIDPYPHTFRRSHTITEARALWERRDPASQERIAVTLAGRITGVRRMGKANFAHIEDQDAKIQLYVSVDKTKDFAIFRDFIDRGDIVGIEGHLFTTRTGELTVEAAKVSLLCKAIEPLPEKYHGLQDLERMRRQRYLHLLAEPDARTLFLKRSKVAALIRSFLHNQGFVEVQTPILQPIYGGAAARPFVTHHNELKRDLYLRIAPELYLKRLIVGGFDKVFEIGNCFRNEGIDSTHNPEFTMVELYQAFADYHDMMTLLEELYKHLARELNGSMVLPARPVHGKEVAIDLSKPWRRLTYFDAIKEYTGVDVSGVSTLADAITAASRAGVKTDGMEKMDWEHVLGEIFDQKVEEHLIEPTFITDFPAGLCPLTKRHRTDPRLAERFEPFIGGMEVANAYSELSDPAYQREQFEAQKRRAAAGDEEAQPMDDDYLLALEYGLPPTGGLGFGLDRLVMLLTGATSVRDIILFPQQRQQADQ
ncbi:MAG: lysine--tRNA ligase [Chloroflexi bacterium]|nr:lysine--tRNA ligase [Chloroflexota bacterium]